MNKVELTKAVSAKTGLQNKEAEAAVEAVFETITGAMASGDFVNVPGFGKFDTKPTAERKGRNPQTGEELIIAAGKKASLKFAKALKDTLKK
ncbi:HU family DNA-binding protein [Paenibacillus sp. FSL H3-0286]|uniref:HU family DNA-binding protein n=1 Tax=Paenibacillus sp. FSL H3-0286 TaxID=2921427 RepID=UPI003254EF6F